MKRWASCCHLLVWTLLLAGCHPALVASPPGPGVPSLTRLEAAPSHVWLGCPVQLRFEFEDPEGNAVRAIAHWTWRWFHFSQNGYQVLPIERRTFAGKTTGQAIVWVTPQHIGTYVYHVQLEDAAGRRSNVMETEVAIELGPAGTGAPPTCEPIDAATDGAGRDARRRVDDIALGEEHGAPGEGKGLAPPATGAPHCERTHRGSHREVSWDS